MKTLTEYTADEVRDMRIEDLTALRRAAIEAQVATMPAEPRLEAWAQRMTARHRSGHCGLHLHGGTTYFPPRDPEGRERLQGAPLSWLGVLLVGQYGEAPDAWPGTWSDRDVIRAAAVEDRGTTFEGARLPAAGEA